MSHPTCRYAIICRAQAIFAGLVIAGLALAGIAPGLAQEEKPGEVESRGMPQIQKPMQPGMPVRPGAPAQQKFQLPTWPQKWDVNNREPYGVAFGVTQPGPVTVDVQSQGAPVIVELYGTAPQPLQRQAGNGAIRLMYQVVPADVQRSVLWQVRIALALPGGSPAQAAGTIAVQHPPADVKAVQAELQTRRTQRRALDPQTQANVKATMDASFQAVMAKFQQEQAARRAALFSEAQSRPLIGGTAPPGPIMPRGIDEAAAATDEPMTTPEGAVAPRAVPDKGRLLNLDLNIAPPSITGFSQWTAQPGDTVLIEGTRFLPNSAGGQVLVVLQGIVAPGGNMPFVAPIQTWSDTQIQIKVPDISGIQSLIDAYVVVERGFDHKRSDPSKDAGRYFLVQPAMELRELPLPPPWGESSVQAPAWPVSGLNEGAASDLTYPPGWFINLNLNFLANRVWVETSDADWLGYRGNDTFFMHKQLKNTWKVFSVEAVRYNVHCPVVGFDQDPASGDVYVAESRIGTSSPYLNVRVWLRPFCALEYWTRIWIKGPKGVPYE